MRFDDINVLLAQIRGEAFTRLSAVRARVAGMSWSISSRGPKNEVVAQVAALKAPDEAQVAQVTDVKAFLTSRVNASPEGNEVTISASGHDDAGGGYVSISFTSSKPQPTT